jgi:hypothetical protein
MLSASLPSQLGNRTAVVFSSAGPVVAIYNGLHSLALATKQSLCDLIFKVESVRETHLEGLPVRAPAPLYFSAHSTLTDLN